MKTRRRIVPGSLVEGDSIIRAWTWEHVLRDKHTGSWYMSGMEKCLEDTAIVLAVPGWLSADGPGRGEERQGALLLLMPDGQLRWTWSGYVVAT